MGKLAVVFFAALAFQAVFGGVTKEFEYDREELGHLVRDAVTVSDNLYEIFHSTPLRRGFSWENREFSREFDEVIANLEELNNKRDEHNTGILYNILRELREIRNYFKELYTCTEETTMRRLEVELATTLKKIAKYFENIDEIFSEEQLTRTTYHTFRTFLRKYTYVLKGLYEKINTREELPSVRRPFYKEESTEKYVSGDFNVENIAEHLQTTLERVHFDNVYMKRTLMYLVREYFETLRPYLTPEFHQFYKTFFVTKDASYSLQDVKTHVYDFVKNYAAKIERMPKTNQVAFVKATKIFEKRLGLVAKINTEARLLAIRVQTLTDMLVNWFEMMPLVSVDYKQIIGENSQRVVEFLTRFLNKVEKTETPEFFNNFKDIVAHLEKTVEPRKFAILLQEVTTEVRKFLMPYPRTTEVQITFTTEYLKVLELIIENFKTLDCSKDVDAWYSYFTAQTNRLSLYMRNDINSEDLKILFKSFNNMLEILEKRGDTNEEYRRFAQTLKEIMREFETERVMANSFLQKITLELNDLLYTIYEKNQHVPKELYEICLTYSIALEEIFYNQRVVKALVTIDKPVELTLEIQSVSDRVAKLLHIIVPGFKTNKIANRVHYFTKMLEIVIYRLHKIEKLEQTNDSELLRKVAQHLREIKNHLEKVLQVDELNTKVNFGVYIENAYFELRKLAFEGHFEQNLDVIKLYADFLFGLEYLLNQIQFDLQVTVEKYNVLTLNSQLGTFGLKISRLLQRTQVKPEMKHIVLLQIQALWAETDFLAIEFKKITGNKIFGEFALKYNKLTEELRQVIKTGESQSIEELCAFLDTKINTITHDLGCLTYYAKETPELYAIYTDVLEVFAGIMARLDNVHYYEYYDLFVLTPEFPEFLRRLTSKVSSKLQTTFTDSEKIKYDVALQTLKFAHRLENIAVRFQVIANVFPRRLHDIVNELQRIGARQSVSVHELTRTLEKCVLATYTEVSKIVEHESTVGTKEALIKYIVAVERLYFNINGILIRVHKDEPFQTMFNRLDDQLHYLIKAIEHVNTEDRRASEVLRSEYRRLYNFITILSKKLTQFYGQTHHIFNKLSEIKFFDHEDNINQLEVTMIECLRQVALVLKQTPWLLHNSHEFQQNTEVNTFFKAVVDEFFTIVQRMHLEIETTVLLPSRMHFYEKWSVSNKATPKYNVYKRNDFETTRAKNWEREEYKPTKMFTFNMENTHELPKWYKHEPLERNWEELEHTNKKYGFNWEESNLPKLYNHETHEYYGGKSPMYSKTTYNTNNLMSVFRDIKDLTRKVTEELREVPLKKEYVRELVQIVERIVNRFEREIIKHDVVKYVVKAFENVKEELEQLVTGHYEQNQMRRQFVNAIEEIVDQFEKIAHVEQHNNLEYMQDIFVQFVKYIRELRRHIENTSTERFYEKDNTNVDEKPFIFGISSHYIISHVNHEFPRKY